MAELEDTDDSDSDEESWISTNKSEENSNVILQPVSSILKIISQIKIFRLGF